MSSRIFRRQLWKSFWGSLRGGFFKNRLAAGLKGWRGAWDAHAQHPGDSRRKVFWGVKRGIFSKIPLLRVSFTAFSFCFFFFCATLLKRKRRTMKFDVGMEKVTLCQGGRIWNPPLRNKSIHCRGRPWSPALRQKLISVGEGFPFPFIRQKV